MCDGGGQNHEKRRKYKLDTKKNPKLESGYERELCRIKLKNVAGGKEVLKWNLRNVQFCIKVPNI